jgi:hypothetical protein
MLTFVNLGSGFTEIGTYFCKLDFCNINFSYLRFSDYINT